MKAVEVARVGWVWGGVGCGVVGLPLRLPVGAVGDEGVGVVGGVVVVVRGVRVVMLVPVTVDERVVAGMRVELHMLRVLMVVVVVVRVGVGVGVGVDGGRGGEGGHGVVVGVGGGVEVVTPPRHPLTTPRVG